MAVRKFKLEIGQSNSGAVGDAVTWEEAFPQIAIRNPQYDASLIPRHVESARGAELWTMAHTYRGGPQVDDTGTITNGQWQNVSTRGSAISALRYLTFYNGTPSFLTYNSFTYNYPAYGTVQAGSTPSQLTTNILAQPARTNDTVTGMPIASPGVVTTSGATFADNDIVSFTVSGGSLPPELSIDDAYVVTGTSGSTFRLRKWPDGAFDLDFSVAGTGTIKAHQADRGTITRVTTGTVHSAACGGPGSARSSAFKLNVDPPFNPPPSPGESFQFQVRAAQASASNKLVPDFRFGGLSDSGGTAIACRMRKPIGDYPGLVTCEAGPMYEGRPVQFADGSGSVAPSGIATLTNHYITRMNSAETLATVLEISPILAGTLFQFTADHKVVTGEKLRVTGSDLPSPLRSGAIYYAVPVTASTMAVSETDGGGAITLTAGTGAVLFERLEALCSFHISAEPGGPELHFDGDATVGTTVQMQPVFRGSLTGTTVRCTSGTRTADGKRNLSHVEYVSVGDTATLVLGDAFAGGVAEDDVFVIEPPAVGDTVLTWDKWAEFLPWCPFEGQAQGSTNAAPFGTNIGADYGDDQAQIVVNLPSAYLGAPFKLFSSGLLPEPLQAGKTYYVTTAASPAVYFSDTYRNVTSLLADPDSAAQYEIKATQYKVTNTSSGVMTVASPHTFKNNEPIKLIGSGVAGLSLTVGTTYYVNDIDETSFSLYSAPGGPAQTIDDAAEPGEVYAYKAFDLSGVSALVEQDGKGNTYPPGFNYPNHQSVPRTYQPFDGPLNVASNPRISHHVGTNLLLHDYLGEPIYVIESAIGGTGLAHREIARAAYGQGLMWFDAKQLLSWSPNEPNNCFSRLMDVLDAAKLAAEKAGDTLECVGVDWAQGEEDSSFSETAGRYAENFRKFVAGVRQAIRDRGMYSGPAETIRWCTPLVAEHTPNNTWQFASTVNAGIQQVADEDPYMRTVTVSDLTFMDDGVHYDGKSMATLARRFFDAWRDMERDTTDAVDICNQALRHIGEGSVVTSIAPPTAGNLHETLCADFFDVALKAALARHNWAHAIRQTSPTAVTATRSAWTYAYALPRDFQGAVHVLPKDALNDTQSSVPFAVETDTNGTLRLLTNEPEAVLRYNSTVFGRDLSRASDLFKRAVSYELASLLAPPIIKGEQSLVVARQMTQMAEFMRSQAVAHDSKKTREVRPRDSEASPWWGDSY